MGIPIRRIKIVGGHEVYRHHRFNTRSVGVLKCLHSYKLWYISRKSLLYLDYRIVRTHIRGAPHRRSPGRGLTVPSVIRRHTIQGIVGTRSQLYNCGNISLTSSGTFQSPRKYMLLRSCPWGINYWLHWFYNHFEWNVATRHWLCLDCRHSSVRLTLVRALAQLATTDRTNADIILIDVINAGGTFIYFILISMVFKEQLTKVRKVKSYRKIIINYV